MDVIESLFLIPPDVSYLSMLLIIIRRIIAFIGIFIILWGALTSGYAFLFHNSEKRKHLSEIDIIRLNFGRMIILGLEFIVAADVIATTMTPDYYTLGILGSLVVIRTFLTYFMNRELASLTKKSTF